MPSAVMKPEKKSPVEAEEPIKTVLLVVEKKVRNLEKRKGKLDEYKVKVKGGAKLNDDQKHAVGKYESVLASLEFARELQKQFTEIQEKAEKLIKKKLKYEQKVQHMEEVARLQEVLRLQSMLDSLGSEDAREHFKNGTNGAVTLSKENLNQLDELYKLISPTRDSETSYAEQLGAASEHLSCFVDGKEKEVAGTTYKALRELANQINECGYFDNSASSETQPDAEEQESSSPVEAEAQESTAPGVPTATEPDAMATSPDSQSHELPSNAEPVITMQPQGSQPTAPLSFTDQSLPTQVQSQSSQPLPDESGAFPAGEEETFFSTVDLNKPRAFTEIVSSVQGSFNFLQDSEIESQEAHVDPAVVAVRPMVPSGAQADAYASQSSAYNAASLQDQMAQLNTQDTGVTADVSADPSLNSSQSYRPPATAPQSPATQFYEEPAAQPTSWATAADQSWGSGAAEHNSWVEQTTQPPNWAEQTSSHQPSAWSSNTGSSQVPAPIPMPNETVPGQSLSFSSTSDASQTQGASYNTAAQQDGQENKSKLNPNANIFSMYGQQQGSGYSQQQDYDQRRGQDGYQGYRGGRDYRGGQARGGGGRGGSRGGGYQGRGGRGGGGGGGSYGNRSGQGAPYQNGGRGGQRSNNGTSASRASVEGVSNGNQGGGSRYQGYGSGRADYLPATGYQGASSYSAAGMRGGPRGGSGGSRGGSRGGNQGYGARPGSGQ